MNMGKRKMLKGRMLIPSREGLQQLTHPTQSKGVGFVFVKSTAALFFFSSTTNKQELLPQLSASQTRS